MARKSVRFSSPADARKHKNESQAATEQDEQNGQQRSAPAHTAQLIVLISLQTLLLIASLLYIPQGIFSKTGPPITLFSGIYDVFNPSVQTPALPAREMENLVRAKMMPALRMTFLFQSFYVSRFGWWWKVAEKIEKHESIKELKKQQGFFKQAEVRSSYLLRTLW